MCGWKAYTSSRLRMELPVVNHEDYFAKIGDDHKFPINKFGELANYLTQKKIVNKFHKPKACSFETLSNFQQLHNLYVEVVMHLE